ncbi:hypothetical protein CVT25_006936 [Psilocybe cyanescens]|uniref:Protein kinase domain-containing protein n=1 Tax=Psilocybe cyanescens TaxID=93625 RepID=A0A409X5X9_PSICY|nr:hypothetical protein CVT25_006936 [Psilocybe cyanescens]
MANTSLKKASLNASSFSAAHNSGRGTNEKDKDEDEDDERHPHSQPTSFPQVPARDELINFLKSPLAPFEASKRATKSTKSRHPRFYDLHLHPDLQLRKIVVVEDLPEKLAEICKKFLSTHLVHLTYSARFPFDKHAERDQTKAARPTAIRNESTLASSYHIRFGDPLSDVTSTLVFKRPKWEGVFEYTLFPRETKDMNFAIPDGFLCVTKEFEATEKVKKALSKEQQEDIDAIIKHNFHHLALWEFKNLFAGSKETMDGFVALKGDFTWPTCDSTGTRCGDVRHTTNNVLSETGRQIGFDAKDVPILKEIFQREEEKAANILTEILQTGAPMAMDEEAEHQTASTSGKVIAAPKTLVDKKTATTAPTSRSTIGKKERKAKDSKRKQETADNIAEPQKPHIMAVQLWSEGVKYDATVLILNAGNYEIICIRRRDTQTLYISRVLSVTDVIYKEAQIGLQALAYYDARDRAYQLDTLERVANPIFPRSYYLKLNPNPYPPVHKTAASLSQNAVVNSDAIYQNLLKELRSKDKFRIMLPRSIFRKNKAYGLYTMIRHSGASMPPEPSVSNWSLELEKRITARVYSVIATNERNSFTDKLVIKLAESSFEYDQLKYEYKTHLRFQNESFGIEVFGIIQVPDSTMHGLLMTWAGFPPEELRRKRKTLVVKKNRENYLKAIEALHAHNSLHGNVKVEHFLMTDAGRVSLISYKPIRLTRTASEIDMDKGKAAEQEDEDERLAKEYAIRMEGEMKLAKNLSLA